jgi:hypothetical protein
MVNLTGSRWTSGLVCLDRGLYGVEKTGDELVFVYRRLIGSGQIATTFTPMPNRTRSSKLGPRTARANEISPDLLRSTVSGAIIELTGT